MFNNHFFALRSFLFSVLSFPIFLLFVSGCSPLLESQKGTKYAPSEELELSELKKSYALFEQMDGIDIALYMNETDFTSLVSKSFDDFSRRFVQLDSDAFSKVVLGQIRLHLSNQQLVSQINFSFEVPSLNKSLFGQLKAKHALQAGVDEFTLMTKFDEIVLDSIDEAQDLDGSGENRELIASAVKNFVQRLNIEIINTPLSIPVDMNILSGINGKDIVYSSDYKFHSASAVKMQTKMQIYLPYIRPDGVLFLGSSELNDSLEESDMNQSSAQLSAALQKEISLSLFQNMGITLETLQKYSSYHVSKAYLAKQMNLALNETDIRILNRFFLQIPKKNQKFSKEIYFFDKNRLPSCEGVKNDCKKRLLSCDRNCSEEYGAHKCKECKNINNPFEKVRCMSLYEACKSKEELHLYSCHKDEDRCEVNNSEIETKCEIENLELFAQCKEKKEKFLFEDDEIVLARLLFAFNIDSSYAVQRIRRIKFDEGMQSLEVMRDMHISVNSRLGVEAKTHSNEELECKLGLSEPILTHSQADYVNQKRRLPLLTQREKEGGLLIKAISKPDFISSHLKKTAYEDLLGSEKFVLNCQYQKMPMEEIPAQRLLGKKDIPYELSAILGEVELQFQEEELSFIIFPVKMGKDILLYPTMEEKAIAFTPRGSFY